ncbi:MAG: hypothetical protein ACI4II_03805 [Acutalibacteraceae bacterium]
MAREYSIDLYGMRDEFISEIAALRKELQNKNEADIQAAGDESENERGNSTGSVLKLKEE